jgi:hypothetical protein
MGHQKLQDTTLYVHLSRRHLHAAVNPLEHVLPRGFPRIRYFGFLANRRRGAFLPLCRTLLAAAPPADVANAGESAARLCPCCEGPMRILEFLTAKQVRHEEARQVPVLDSS